MFSFHATKLFNTIEGGVTYNDSRLKDKISEIRNFGIIDENTVSNIGLNGKMNEIQAAYGLLNLKIFPDEQSRRRKIKDFYNTNLSKIKGVRIPQMPENTTNSYQYYPIIIEDNYPISRDELYDRFKNKNIYTRKYFYPACHDYGCYKIEHTNLTIVDDLKYRVLCLPFYGALEEEDLAFICHFIKEMNL